MRGLCQDGQHQYSFHPGKALADATTRAAAEREVRELRPRGAGVRSPSLGIELKWIREITRIVMHDVRAHDHDRPGRDAVAANFAVLKSPAAYDPHWGIQAHRFRQH